MSPRAREVKVGLVILAALAVVAAAIFLIGDRNNLFASKSRYFIEFSSVSGLKRGNPVQLDGVDVGAISKVELPASPWRKQIRVWITIESEYAARIRGPQEGQKPVANQTPSVARIKTLGLLGDKYIEITSGSPGYELIPDQGEIPAAQPTNVDALIASGEDVMDNVVQISSSLNKILSRIDRGEGLLGELTSDSEPSRRLRESLLDTSETLGRVAHKLDSGQGPVPRLLNDRALADQLAGSLDRLQSLLDQAQHGPGLLPGLLNDPASRQQFNETLASLRKVAQDLQGFTADLDKSDALLPRLVKDETYGREVTEQVRETVQHLNSVANKLDKGDGTAAKLINDPQIYDAVNDVIVGVHESRILRWLIRNRQKAGIQKRYDVTRKAIEGQGGTPEPLDAAPEGTPEPRPPRRLPETAPETTPAEATPVESTPPAPPAEATPPPAAA